MSILIIRDRNSEVWKAAIEKKNPEIEVEIYPEVKDKEAIEYALVWNHPPGVFKQFPNIKVIASMGAGVDHILRDPELPENAKITRVVDEQLTEDMADFVLTLVLNHLRNINLHQENEQNREWKPEPYQRITDVKVGILGIGELGSIAGKKLSHNGFNVIGWARSKKELESIKVYAGQEELDDFLAESDVLICLLPLTPETENILNQELFEKLPKNAYLINVARGKHLVEEDLIIAIDKGQLSGAALDVFREEPLPAEHLFWAHPKIHLTPHVASVTNPSSVVFQVLENYQRMRNGEGLKNVVSKEKGY